jgi:hypothetical protein
MIGIISFFGTFLGRASMVAALVASLLAWRAWDIHKQRSIGEERAQVQMEKAANANARKAEKARNSVQSIPADRLRDKYFRD